LGCLDKSLCDLARVLHNERRDAATAVRINELPPLQRPSVEKVIKIAKYRFG
jgi:hypothetical protein